NGALFGNMHQLFIQAVAVLASGIYAFVATYIILKVLMWVKMPLRVSSAEEATGLDVAVHGEPGYQI
ncbi:MAG TPA: ammonia channel protein, partial [Candidatus Paceibacterota bacterium]|nr:ammonia channel protein [Candidatus Paceibacterota bacterium]